jgi:dephospho-CoA kinase
MTVVKLALCGQLRSGKDTLTDYATIFYDFQPFAFAKKGKEIFHELFPHIPPSPKPRKAYQDFINGITELPIEGAETVWVDYTLRKVDDYIKRQCCRGARVIITDVRKQIEYEALKNAGFTLIRITAPENVRIERARQAGDNFTVEDLQHKTELLIGSFDVDYEINNDRSTIELYEKFDGIMRELGVNSTHQPTGKHASARHLRQ